MSCTVKVLQDGYSRWVEPPNSMSANGSCTLVRGNSINVLVDTLGPWDREILIEKLALEQLHPDDVKFVVCTHSHPDHIGNLNLFTNASKHIVGKEKEILTSKLRKFSGKVSDPS